MTDEQIIVENTRCAIKTLVILAKVAIKEDLLYEEDRESVKQAVLFLEGVQKIGYVRIEIGNGNKHKVN